MNGISIISHRLGCALQRIYLAFSVCILSAVAAAVSVNINAPANGTMVTRGQVVSISASFSGSVAGVQQVRISGAGDADGYDDVYSYSPSPPKQSGTVTGSFTVPSSATNGQNFAITVTVTDYVDGPINTSINLIASVTPPANDNFANAIVISGATGSVTGNNVNASKETGEPTHGTTSSGKSIWWKWTAPTTKRVQIDTKTSSFDTLLGVYTGSSVSALTLVAQDDQSGGKSTSLVTINAVAGVTYNIAVAGWGSSSGNVVLNWTQDLDGVLNVGVDLLDQAFDPVKNRLYGANYGNKRIEVINPDTPAIIGNIPLADAPNGIDVSPDGSRLIVAHEAAKKLTLINLNTASIIMTTSTTGITADGPRHVGFIRNDLAMIGIGDGWTQPPLLFNIATNTFSKLTLSNNEIGMFAGGANTPQYIATSGVSQTAILCGYDETYTFDSQPTQTARGLLNEGPRDIDAADDGNRFLHLNNDPMPILRVLDSNLNVLLTVTSSQYGHIVRAQFLPDSRYVALLLDNSPSVLKIINATTGEVVATKNPDINSFNTSHAIWMTMGNTGPGGRQQVIFVDRSWGNYKITFTDVTPVPASNVSDWAVY